MKHNYIEDLGDLFAEVLQILSEQIELNHEEDITQYDLDMFVNKWNEIIDKMEEE